MADLADGEDLYGRDRRCSGGGRGGVRVFELLDVHATVRKNTLCEGPGPILLVRLETGRIQA